MTQGEITYYEMLVAELIKGKKKHSPEAEERLEKAYNDLERVRSVRQGYPRFKAVKRIMETVDVNIAISPTKYQEYVERSFTINEFQQDLILSLLKQEVDKLTIDNIGNSRNTKRTISAIARYICGLATVLDFEWEDVLESSLNIQD